MIVVYICPLHTTVTQCDIQEAVMPVFITCPHCNNIAVKEDTEFNEHTHPTHEWYIPAKKGRGITKEVKRQFKVLGIYLREIKKETNECENQK